MNKFAPPLLILLDVMFVFLFALVLKPDKATFDIIPIAENIPYTKIVKLDSNNKIIAYYESENWINDDLSLFNFNITIDEVKNYPESSNNNIQTVIYGKTYANLTSKIYVECHLRDTPCYGKIKVYLNENGRVEKLIK
jgi:hypothetical protein